MQGRLLVLKLVAEGIGLSANIDTLVDRKNFQKAIYLTQKYGLDLGYKYGWYVMGPYSSSLARDYYALSESIDRGDAGIGKKLNKIATEVTSKVRALLEAEDRPDDMLEDQWSELLASLDYLITISGKTEDEATKVIEQEKPHLVAFVDQAKGALFKAGLDGRN